MSCEPLGGHGKLPRVPRGLGAPPTPPCSQALRLNAALENKVDSGLSQTRRGEDSRCPSPGRRPPPLTSVQSLPLFPELGFPRGPIQARVMIKAAIDEHFLCARHWAESSRPISSLNSHHRPTGLVHMVPKMRLTEVRGPVSRSRWQGRGRD